MTLREPRCSRVYVTNNGENSVSVIALLPIAYSNFLTPYAGSPTGIQ